MFILFHVDPEILVINLSFLSENTVYIVINVRTKSTDQEDCLKINTILQPQERGKYTFNTAVRLKGFNSQQYIGYITLI